MFSSVPTSHVERISLCGRSPEKRDCEPKLSDGHPQEELRLSLPSQCSLASLRAELGSLPGRAGDGVGHFPFGEVTFIIITGFCQDYRNWGEKKEKGLITDAIYQTTLVKILHFKTP